MRPREHAHRWGPWERRVPIVDYLGNVIDMSWATFHGARPAQPGWTRLCQGCGRWERTE